MGMIDMGASSAGRDGKSNFRNIDRWIQFNRYVVLAAGGFFLYSVDQVSGDQSGSIRLISTLGIIALCIAIVLGWFFEGKAAQLERNEYDADMGRLGNLCFAAFLVGAVLVALSSFGASWFDW